jgi:hypothetical protein
MVSEWDSWSNWGDPDSSVYSRKEFFGTSPGQLTPAPISLRLRVRKLERALRAEIVIQEGKSHFEEEQGHLEEETGHYEDQEITECVNDSRWCDSPTNQTYTERVYVIDRTGGYVVDKPAKVVVDQERIARPDIEKRESARKELTELKSSLKWYNFYSRYRINRALKK